EACDERSAMNVATVAPLPAAALMRADEMRVLVLLRPTMARFAPSAASASAAANPMPLVAPVIRICLSFTAQQSNAMATLGRPVRWSRTQRLTMECQNRGSRRAPASRSSSSTHTPIDAFKGAAALGTRANTCIVARDLINALHNADRRGKEDFPSRGA